MRVTMKKRRIAFKNEDIECNFTYLYDGDLSLVIDVIRHYERVVLRGFAATQHGKRDFSNLFPFPNGEDPFSGESGGNRITMDIEGNAIEGNFGDEPPISLSLSFTIEDYYFSSTIPRWIDKVPVLNKLYQSIRLTRVVSLLHEDFPLVTFDGDVTLGTEHYHLDRANGAIAHHWGWYFPNYLFLMCNGFEDPGTLLTLSFADSITSAGIGIKSGYLYLHHHGKEKKLISPVQGKVISFWEGGKLSIVARFDEGDFVRVNIDPGKGIAFPNVFNTTCLTLMNVGCEIEGIGKSDRAVLDVKGLDVMELMKR